MLRRLLLLVFVSLFLLSPLCADARSFTDSAGRTVELPASINKVFAAGPPASVLVYTLAPAKLAGWVSAPRERERPYLAAPYVDLPVHGRLTGRGGSANIEAVVAMQPDLVLDVGTISDTYVDLADRVQTQTGVPTVLLDGAFARTPELYRELGRLLGEEAKGAELAGYAQGVLDEVSRGLAGMPAGERQRVYYGRGPDGLETGLAGSITLEIVEAAGAANVAAAAGPGGLTRVSPEQVLAWDPSVIVTLDPNFYASLRGQGFWRNVAAVAKGRVYLSPAWPFGWIDSPPGVNRLIGIRWLAGVLYPDRFPTDLRALTRDFYARFYHVELDEPRLDALLAGAVAAPH